MFPMVFNAMGRPELNFKMSLVCVLVFPICYFVGGHIGFNLGDQEGAMLGVCLVWMICFPLVAMGLVHLTRRVTSVGLKELFWSQRAVAVTTLFMAATVLAVQWSLPEMPRLARLFLAIGTGIVAYAGPMLLFCRRSVLADLWILWRELKGQG
jgi:hypothetical protein